MAIDAVKKLAEDRSKSERNARDGNGREDGPEKKGVPLP